MTDPIFPKARMVGGKWDMAATGFQVPDILFLTDEQTRLVPQIKELYMLNKDVLVLAERFISALEQYANISSQRFAWEKDLHARSEASAAKQVEYNQQYQSDYLEAMRQRDVTQQEIMVENYRKVQVAVESLLAIIKDKWDEDNDTEETDNDPEKAAVNA